MKYRMIVVVTIFCFLFGWVGASNANTAISPMNPDSIGLHFNTAKTAEDHLTKAQNLEKEIERLEAQVSELKQDVARYNEKPYLDTKGFRRNGLKLLIGTSEKKISNIRKIVAWHRTEATRLTQVEKGALENTSDFEATSSTSGDHSPSPPHHESVS
ncbi:MAG TPA: hypothetical protein PKK23_11965 [Nitrospirales bacterium]|nr:hypothetical protein [Nitrospiraceae bacterium]HNP29756.1 hypothetical protein [Nitrospirales bacterium]